MTSIDLGDIIGAAQQDMNSDGTLGLTWEGPLGDPAADIEALINEAVRMVVKASAWIGAALVAISLF